MAIIPSYPQASAGPEDLLLGINIIQDQGVDTPKTRSFPVSSIINLATAAVPAFVPSDYDLDKFTNENVDPFAKISDIPAAPGLQEVLDVNNTVTNGSVMLFNSPVIPENLSFFTDGGFGVLGRTAPGEKYFGISLFPYEIQFSDGPTTEPSAFVGTILKASNYDTGIQNTYELPSKPAGTYTLSTTEDIPVIQPVSATETGVVNNTSLQELGGVDKTINGVRVGRGNIAGNVSGNTVIGNQALQSVINTTGTEGYNNTAVGSGALKSLTTGSYNTAIGNGSGGNATSSGSSNILVGFQAGRDVSTGTNNLLIENLDIPPLGTIKIGTQIWTTKNLNVTTYRDGTLISESDWDYYENNLANEEIYGKLYKGSIINDPRGLAPLGYHIPTDAEWTILTDYLLGLTVAGGKMKATGTSLWQSPNTGATNESGFTGLPGGFFQAFNGAFNNQSTRGYFWSSSELETDSTKLWYRYINHNNDDAVRTNSSKINGFSVRLIKDANPSITSGSYNIILNPKEKSGVTTGSNNTIIGCFDNTLSAGLTSNVIIGNGTGAIRFQSTDTGLTTVPAQTNTLINGDASGKAVVTKEYLSGVVKPYKVYTALLTQAGTTAPTAVVLENTLNVNISNQYVTNGNYNIISGTPIFLTNKVFFVYPSLSTQNLSYRIKIIRSSDTTINFQVIDSAAVGVNDGITDHSIEIRVYN